MTKATRPSAMAWVAVIAVGGLAAMLRPGATSVGPVLQEVRDSLHLSPTLAGVLTSLPGFCFAAGGTIAVAFARRFGTAGTLTVGLVMITAGLIGRSLATTAVPFMLLTVLALLGAALGNIMTPVFIKRFFPNRPAPLLSVYSIGLATGATVPGLITPALMSQDPVNGWRLTLGIWGVAAAVVALPWLWLALREWRQSKRSPAPSQPGHVWSLVRSPRAVALTVFFGFQSMQAYVTFGWLAQILRDSGVSADQASLLVSWYAFLGFPAGLLMPQVVGRSSNLRPWVIGFGVLLASGFLGLGLAPARAPFLWVTLIAVAGFAFPTALALIGARTRAPEMTARLSSFVQSIAYLMSGLGPFAIGVVHEVTGAWTIPTFVMAFTAVFMVWGGLRVARPGFVDDDMAAVPEK